MNKRGQTTDTYLLIFHIIALASVMGLLMFHATNTDTNAIHRSFRSTHLSQAITSLSFWPNQADYSFYSSNEFEYKDWQEYDIEIMSDSVLSYNPKQTNANPLQVKYASTTEPKPTTSSRKLLAENTITLQRGDGVQLKDNLRKLKCRPSKKFNLSIHLDNGGLKDQYYNFDGDLTTGDVTTSLDGFKTIYHIDNEQVIPGNPGKNHSSDRTDATILREIASGLETTYESNQYLENPQGTQAVLKITDSTKENIVIRIPYDQYEELYPSACNFYNDLVGFNQISIILSGSTILPTNEEDVIIEIQSASNPRLLTTRSIISSVIKAHFKNE